MVGWQSIELTIRDVQFSDEPNGERTIQIGGGQAMQSWERDLMEESASILCSGGGEFLEVGLGFGYSALKISELPGVTSHLVLEKRDQVMKHFRNGHPHLPSNLVIQHADVFEVIETLGRGRFDGIYFDPSLPMTVWDDRKLWQRVTPTLKASLKVGGKILPFFTTRPVLREQFAPYFSKVDVYRRQYVAFESTEYTFGRNGDAYIQLYYD